MKTEQIVILLEKEGIIVNKRQADQLKQYVKLLKLWNTKIRLISKGDQIFVEERHVLPSFLFVKFLSDKTAGDKLTVLDLGTGAGLPGVVLSIMFPDVDFILLDSSRKKTLFLNKVKEEIRLRYRVVCDRFEEWVKNEEKSIDWVVARAVAPLGELIALVQPILKKKAKLVTLKGLDFEKEYKKELNDKYLITPVYFDKGLNRFSEYLENKCLVKVEFKHG